MSCAAAFSMYLRPILIKYLYQISVITSTLEYCYVNSVQSL